MSWLSDEELESLLTDLESDRVERTQSLPNGDKIPIAICAFANDLSDHRKPGVIFVGIRDDGSCAGLEVTDELLKRLGDYRGNGKIQPLPSITVEKKMLNGCEVAAVVVMPSDMPPVRYDGRTWIRIGPRRDKASLDEERRLTEKRRHRVLPFDMTPVPFAQLDDLDVDRFRREYLPQAIAPDILAQNGRSLVEQLVSLRFIDGNGQPTVAGILAIGKDPRAFLPGAYVQFLRIDGTELNDPIQDAKEIDGPFLDLFRQLDEVLKVNIATRVSFAGMEREHRQPDYPFDALQQIVRNAILHRNYEGTNAPVRLYWFRDRIEVHNPGGPFGQVTVGNFGGADITDYRNPTLAEVMKTLGYVQKFGFGIALARRALAANGNPEWEPEPRLENVLVTIRRRP